MHIPSQSFCLLLAPPAWGKTRLIRHWIEEAKHEFLFVSPLRALALEVQSAHPTAWVALPEDLRQLDWEGLARSKPALVVVWDEVHLVSEWGESFRHEMLEAWWGFCISGLAGIGLTATLTPSCQEFLQATLGHSHTHLLVGDAGNMRFYFSPRDWWWGPEKWVTGALKQKLPGRTLIFCHHRFEVEAWCRKLRALGISVWGCKGGETAAFRHRLQTEKLPEVFVATSCLSHGINLPTLARVVLLNRTASPWLLHQMATRAGRDGGHFEVWAVWGVAFVPWRLRPRALLRACLGAMMGGLEERLKAWWYGT